jgi:tetratricopeptide (TPR) repeat protein
MERMRAHEFLGHLLLQQKRYDEAVKSYQRALSVVGANLSEDDATLARLWGNLAISHHFLRDLGKARAYYKKAEQIYQNAYTAMGSGDSDEWVGTTKQEYLKSLETLLDYHLLAAREAGATAEVEEISKLKQKLIGRSQKF